MNESDVIDWSFHDNILNITEIIYIYIYACFYKDTIEKRKKNDMAQKHKRRERDHI